MRCHFRIPEELQVVLLGSRQSKLLWAISAELAPVKQSSMVRDIAGIISLARFLAGLTVLDLREIRGILDLAAGINSRMVLGYCTQAICSLLRRKDKNGQGTALVLHLAQAELDHSRQPMLGGWVRCPHPEVPGCHSKGMRIHPSSRCILLFGVRTQIMGGVPRHPALGTSSGPSQPSDKGLTPARGGRAICEDSLHRGVHSLASLIGLTCEVWTPAVGGSFASIWHPVKSILCIYDRHAGLLLLWASGIFSLYVRFIIL